MRRVVCGICLGALMMIMLSVFACLFTSVVLVKRMNVHNSFTSQLIVEKRPEVKRVFIDWEALYPFKTDQAVVFRRKKKSFSLDIKRVKTSIEKYATERLIVYHKLIEMAKRYEAFIHWNYVSYYEQNGIFKLEDGYLTNLFKKRDNNGAANATIGFSQFCRGKNINLLYIQAPYKICKYNDINISNVLDYSNQNADVFLELLRNSQVDTCDYREVIHQEGKEHHRLFYKTDHHWRVETGFWAAQHILNVLKNHYNLSVDKTVLQMEKFKAVNYPALFLGSQGKKVSLTVAKPEDFSIFYPTYRTCFSYEIPNLGINKVGEFSIMYDMAQVEKADYYNKNPYDVCNYGNRPLIKIENKLLTDNTRVLLIKDSYANCVVPFMALGLKSLAVMDLRYFTGSVKSFINSFKPNMVIILYNASSIGIETEEAIENNFFDFN